MDNDLLINNYTEKINLNLVRSNIKLLTAALTISIFYTILTCVEWYWVIMQSQKLQSSSLTFYYYRIFPVLLAMNLYLNIIAGFTLIRGNKKMIVSVEKEDPSMFNEGYLLFARFSLMGIAAGAISVADILIRFYLKYKL